MSIKEKEVLKATAIRLFGHLVSWEEEPKRYAKTH